MSSRTRVLNMYCEGKGAVTRSGQPGSSSSVSGPQQPSNSGAVMPSAHGTSASFRQSRTSSLLASREESCISCSRSSRATLSRKGRSRLSCGGVSSLTSPCVSAKFTHVLPSSCESSVATFCRTSLSSCVMAPSFTTARKSSLMQRTDASPILRLFEGLSAASALPRGGGGRLQGSMPPVESDEPWPSVMPCSCRARTA